MKRLLVLFCLCVVCLSYICGCRNNRSPAKPAQKPPDIAVFPPELAGTWECNEQGLEIVLEPNGVVASAIIPFGELNMRPGEKIEIKRPEVGYRGVFQAGPYTVDYDLATRELTVDLSLEHYRAEMPGAIFEGNTRDIFIGKVSRDGTTWEAEWFSFHIMKDPNSPEIKADPNNSPMPPVFFRKKTSGTGG